MGGSQHICRQRNAIIRLSMVLGVVEVSVAKFSSSVSTQHSYNMYNVGSYVK